MSSRRDRLRLENVTAFYGVVAPCREISLTLADGECVGLTGPNGAGKTSLLKAVAGLIPAVGRIVLAGQDIGGWSSTARLSGGLVYVPQEHVVIGGISCRENLRLFHRVLNRRRRGTSFKQRLAYVLEAFPELAGRLDVPAFVLSGGQRQMLALSRVVIAEEPRLVLLDEPTAGLAPAIADRMASLVREFRDRGLSMLVVEHHPAILERVDRVVLMASGELAG